VSSSSSSYSQSSSSSSSSSSTSSSSSSTSYEPYENLKTFIEVDEDGDLTISPLSASFVTMRRDANTYVFKDYGADYFKDFDFEFELEITAGDTQGNALLCAVSNFPSGGFQNLRNNNDFM
jgi:hypothetical protein